MPSAAHSRNGALALPLPQVESTVIQLPDPKTEGQSSGVKPVGGLQATQTISGLYAELKTEQQKTETLLGRDRGKLLADLHLAAHSEGLETLMRTRRTHILAERDPETATVAKAKREDVERQIVEHCQDRIQRFRGFNSLLETGAIDLGLLGKIQDSGSTFQFRNARNEVLELFRGDAIQREVRFVFPRPDDTRPSGVIRPGLGQGPESRLSAEQLLSGPRDLRTSLIAVQGEFARLKSAFPNPSDFERVLVWSGAQQIDYHLGVHSSKGILLGVTGDAAQREKLIQEQKKEERIIGNLAVDFIERSESLRKLLANPNASKKLFDDITPATRLAYENHLRYGGASEDATRYHKSIRQLVSIINMSPEQIEAAAKVYPPAPMVPPLNPGSPYSKSGGERRVVARPLSGTASTSTLESQPTAGPVSTGTPVAPASTDFSGLPYVNRQSALLRERAFNRCVFEMQEVVKVALGSRFHAPSADGLPPSQSMLALAAKTHRVQNFDLGDDRGAMKMANDTNSLLERARKLEGPLRELSDLRDELQKQLELAKRSKFSGADFEKELLRLREECAEKAKKVIARDLPMLKGEDLPLLEMILPNSDIRRLLGEQRRSSVVLPPPAVRPTESSPRTAIAEAEPRGVIARPVVPTTSLPPPAYEPVTVTRQAVLLGTDNRMALQRLAACETSLIHIHGTVNGEPLYVGYDATKNRIISDAASAEKMGVRFIDTGEKGPNGLPKIQLEFTRPGQFAAEYNGVNLRTAARWNGSVVSPTPPDVNMGRLKEAQSLGADRWQRDMQSAARFADGKKYQYAYSTEDARLYAKSPDGKNFLAYDALKNSWHYVSPESLPPSLQPGVRDLGA